jgi:hypothetical protein
MMWILMRERRVSEHGTPTWGDLEHLIVLHGLRTRRSGANHTFTNEDVEGAYVLLADPWPLRNELGHTETRGDSAPCVRGSDADLNSNRATIEGEVGDNRFETPFIALLGHTGAPGDVPLAEGTSHTGTIRYIFEALPPLVMVAATPAGTSTHSANSDA